MVILIIFNELFILLCYIHIAAIDYWNRLRVLWYFGLLDHEMSNRDAPHHRQRSIRAIVYSIHYMYVCKHFSARCSYYYSSSDTGDQHKLIPQHSEFASMLMPTAVLNKLKIKSNHSIGLYYYFHLYKTLFFHWTFDKSILINRKNNILKQYLIIRKIYLLVFIIHSHL